MTNSPERQYAKFTEFWRMRCVCVRLWPFAVRTTFPKKYLPYLSANTLQFSTSMGIGQWPVSRSSVLCQVSIIPTFLLERYVLETKNALKVRLYFVPKKKFWFFYKIYNNESREVMEVNKCLNDKQMILCKCMRSIKWQVYKAIVVVESSAR